MKGIVIIGAGGFGREVLEIIRDINKIKEEWTILGFVDDSPHFKDQVLNNYPVLGDSDWLLEYAKNKEIFAVIAIGDSSIREKLVLKIGSIVQFANLIHPSAMITDTVKMGVGNIITAGCIVSVNIEIGNHVIINLHSTIGHDCVLDDYCSIMPGVNVSGTVHLEKGVFLGTGVKILQNKTIGAKTIIGAGLTIHKNMPPNIKAIPKINWSEIDNSSSLFKKS